MRRAYSAQQVREAEVPLLAELGDEPVMRRAAFGLEVACARILAEGGVPASRVVLLVGSGNNGGDALWAGAGLARRGASVVAVACGAEMHVGGRRALERAGGRVVGAAEGVVAVRDADLVVDGILGIGGRGALRGDAATLAAAAVASGAAVVACDLPSGIDPDTGAVPDPSAAVRADLTVTFGALKVGALLMPAAELVGVLHLVDIGLGPHLAGEPPAARCVQAVDVALSLGRPGPESHKYSRGVVEVLAGSAAYPGAGVLAVGAARHGGAGLVRYVGGAAHDVVARYPDVVVAADPDPRVTAHLVGPGLQPGMEVPDAVRAPCAVVLDATALREVGRSPEWASAVRDRADAGLVTVVTPHDGELIALGGRADLLEADRIGAAREVADRLGCATLLKGATTVVAAPGGAVWVNPVAPPCLATAGSGDVLAGLAASWLAADGARAPLGTERAAEVMAHAAWLHAVAGRVADSGGAPVAALDILDALPAAVAAVTAEARP